MENQNLYVPKSQETAKRQYEALKHCCRAVEPSDQGAIGLEAVLIHTKGKPPRQSFAGFERVQVDIGRVTAKMCDVFIRRISGKDEPLRFKIETQKLLIMKGQ